MTAADVSDTEKSRKLLPLLRGEPSSHLFLLSPDIDSTTEECRDYNKVKSALLYHFGNKHYKQKDIKNAVALKLEGQDLQTFVHMATQAYRSAVFFEKPNLHFFSTGHS